MKIEKGQTIDHYRFVEKIGEGGMGVVWKAMDTKLDREVAVKMLPEQFAEDHERLTRFEREAKVVASLNHPHIAGIHGLEESNGMRFLVMEMVPGTNLLDRLSSGPLTVEDALEVARQIADALEAAHEMGIVHRDVKPANIQVTPEGTVKILDFGLAKALEGDADSLSGSMSPTLTTPATRAGMIMGTAAYMSPEQAKGKKVDRRADIWAFGCVLYEMLVGTRPFKGEAVTELLAAVLMSTPDMEKLPAGTPSSVKRLLKRCFEKDPRKRLRDIGEARIVIEAILSGEAVEEREGADRPTPSGKSSRSTALAWAAGALIFGVLAASATWFLKPVSEKTVRRFELAVEPTAQLGDSESTVAISPQGTKLAYVSRGKIVVREMEKLEERFISVTGDPQLLTWSPDGEWLAYGLKDKIWKVPSTGGESTLIADVGSAMAGGSRAHWSDDGRIILSKGIDHIYEVSVSGGDLQILHERDPEADRDMHDVHLLPGGRGILYVRHLISGNPEALSVVNEEGRKVLLQHPGEYIWGPVYSPTGHILYHRISRASGIWAVPFSLSKLETTGEPFLVAAGGSQPSISHDGTLSYLSGGSFGLWMRRFENCRACINGKRIRFSS